MEISLNSRLIREKKKVKAIPSPYMDNIKEALRVIKSTGEFSEVTDRTVNLLLMFGWTNFKEMDIWINEKKRSNRISLIRSILVIEKLLNEFEGVNMFEDRFYFCEYPTDRSTPCMTLIGGEMDVYHGCGSGLLCVGKDCTVKKIKYAQNIYDYDVYINTQKNYGYKVYSCHLSCFCAINPREK